MFDLDSIISATEATRAGCAVILSEENDTSKIDWRAGVSDVTEMVKMGGNVVQAALGRASLDTTGGKVALFVARKPAWHKLGVLTADAVNSADARRLAGLTWEVVKLPLSFTFNGQTVESNEAFAIVRRDTGKQLGTVGARYTPIQNGECFDYLDDVLAAHGARYESAGSLYGGEKVFMVAQLPELTFSVNGKDKVLPYVTFTNCHDGSGAAYCFPTEVRAECANTLRIAMRDRDKGISIRHTGNVRDKVKRAQTALGLAVKGFERFQGQAEQMAATPMPSMRAFADDVLDACLDVTAAQARLGVDALAATLDKTQANIDLARKSAAAMIERRGEILHDILDRYEGARNGVNGMRGTAWSGFNAITEHADHNRLGRQRGTDEDRNSRRFESILNGEADTMKQAALAVAVR